MDKVYLNTKYCNDSEVSLELLRLSPEECYVWGSGNDINRDFTNEPFCMVLREHRNSMIFRFSREELLEMMEQINLVLDMEIVDG